MKLITIGSIAFDSITTPFGQVTDALGGSACYFSLAASYFQPPGVVAVVGEDFSEQHMQTLLKRNVDLEGVKRTTGQTFRWAGKYSFDLNNRETLYTHLNVFENFNPKSPAGYEAAEYVFLGNISPRLQQSVLTQTANAKYIALDTMNFWIEQDRPGLLEVLRRIHALIINDAEARQLAQEYNIVKTAKKILGFMDAERNPLLIIKRGEYGLLMFQGDNIFNLPGFPLENVFDPTGAGDSFAGGFMGYLSASENQTWENLQKACVAGSVLASFCVEKMGTERLTELANEEIQKRSNLFRQLTQFELGQTVF